MHQRLKESTLLNATDLKFSLTLPFLIDVSYFTRLLILISIPFKDREHNININIINN